MAEDSNGQVVYLSGEFAGNSVFVRPYVMANNKSLCGYHGGDLYPWKEKMPAALYHLFEQGQVNPVFAIHKPDEISTAVNLFNSHGYLEDDYDVDIWLYDQDGKCVANRKNWLCAKRNQVTRAEIVDLLPDKNKDFIGHLDFAL